ncbi:MAG: hypothetical protein ACM3PP_12055 [Candidatus Saccharibacteria bacterium]
MKKALILVVALLMLLTGGYVYAINSPEALLYVNSMQSPINSGTFNGSISASLNGVPTEELGSGAMFISMLNGTNINYQGSFDYTNKRTCISNLEIKMPDKTIKGGFWLNPQAILVSIPEFVKPTLKITPADLEMKDFNKFFAKPEEDENYEVLAKEFQDILLELIDKNPEMMKMSNEFDADGYKTVKIAINQDQMISFAEALINRMKQKIELRVALANWVNNNQIKEDAEKMDEKKIMNSLKEAETSIDEANENLKKSGDGSFKLNIELIYGIKQFRVEKTRLVMNMTAADPKSSQEMNLKITADNTLKEGPYTGKEPEGAAKGIKEFSPDDLTPEGMEMAGGFLGGPMGGSMDGSIDGSMGMPPGFAPGMP